MVEGKVIIMKYDSRKSTAVKKTNMREYDPSYSSKLTNNQKKMYIDTSERLQQTLTELLKKHPLLE